MRQLLTKKERIRRMAEKLPAALAKELDDNQDLEITDVKLYSKFRISCTTVTVGSGTHTIAFPAQTISLFQYGIGETMVNAGFPSTWTSATRADTNLLKGGKTNNGKVYGIEAVSFLLTARNDAEVLRNVWDNLYASFTIGGSARAKHLGIPHFLGAAGGLWGPGESRIATPNMQDVRSTVAGFMQNGIPSEDGGFDLGEVLVWGPPGKQGINDSISLDMELTRAISCVGTARTEDVAVEQIAAFTPPVAQTAISDTMGTFVECWGIYHGLEIGGAVRL